MRKIILIAMTAAIAGTSIAQTPAIFANTPSTPATAFSAAASAQTSQQRIFRDRMDDGRQGPEMVAIPGGRFIMGSSPDEAGRDSDEGPQREVTVFSFAAGKYDVTWAEWALCTIDGGCPKLRDDGFGQGSRPVTNVSWRDAQAYATWLRRKTGAAYRLLSEAEWEYAARAGASTAFSTGDTIAASQANFNRNVGATTPSGAYQSNAFGLYDMQGNVWQWVEDCYASSYAFDQPKDGRPYTKDPCSERVLRGGSWGNAFKYLRTAVRDGEKPTTHGIIVGFRIARTR